MDTKSFHLERQPAPEGLLTGVSSEGEFHEIAQSASEALLTGVAPTGEIHLEQQPAPEDLLTGVIQKVEFQAVPLQNSLHIWYIAKEFLTLSL